MSYTASEHWRMNCEASFLLRAHPTGDERAAYIARVAKKRGKGGKEYAELLRATAAHRNFCRKNGIPIPPYPVVPKLSAEAGEWSQEYGWAEGRR